MFFFCVFDIESSFRPRPHEKESTLANDRESIIRTKDTQQTWEDEWGRTKEKQTNEIEWRAQIIGMQRMISNKTENTNEIQRTTIVEREIINDNEIEIYTEYNTSLRNFYENC